MRISGIRIWIRVAFAVSVVATSFIGTAVVGSTAAGASGSAALSVQDFSFSPATLTVPAGTTVTVTNHGAVTHTWASDPGSGQTWNSGNLNPGASFSVTFNTAGTFGYHCNIHTFMTGRIVVTAAPASTTVPPPPTTTATTAAPTATTAPAAARPATPPTSGGAIAAAAPTVLPHTGASMSAALAAVAVALTLSGALLMFLASKARRRRTF